MASLVRLLSDHLEIVENTNCEMCFAPLSVDAVQMICCSQIYHRGCVHGWAKAESSTPGSRSSPARCPYCQYEVGSLSWYELDRATALSWSDRRERLRRALPRIADLAKLELWNVVDVLNYISNRVFHLASKKTASIRDPLYRRFLIDDTPEKDRYIVRQIIEDSSCHQDLLYWWHSIPKRTRIEIGDIANRDDGPWVLCLVSIHTIAGPIDSDYMPVLSKRLLKPAGQAQLPHPHIMPNMALST